MNASRLASDHLMHGIHLRPRTICRFVVSLCLSVFCERWSQDFNDHHQLITLLPSLKELTLSPPPPRLILPTSNRLQILRFDLRDYFEQYGGDNPKLHLVDPLEFVAQHFWISISEVCGSVQSSSTVADGVTSFLENVIGHRLSPISVFCGATMKI